MNAPLLVVLLAVLLAELQAELQAWLQAGLPAGLLAGLQAGLRAGLQAGLRAGLAAGLLAGLQAGLRAGLQAGLRAGPAAVPPIARSENGLAPRALHESHPQLAPRALAGNPRLPKRWQYSQLRLVLGESQSSESQLGCPSKTHPSCFVGVPRWSPGP